METGWTVIEAVVEEYREDNTTVAIRIVHKLGFEISRV
jgi:hypothetical protein